jgi:hypothetical protein
VIFVAVAVVRTQFSVDRQCRVRCVLTRARARVCVCVCVGGWGVGWGWGWGWGAHACTQLCFCLRWVTHPCMLSGIDHACMRVGRRGRCVQGGGHVLAYAQNVKHEAQCQSEEPTADTACRPQHSSNRHDDKLSTTSLRQRQSSRPIDNGTPQNKAKLKSSRQRSKAHLRGRKLRNDVVTVVEQKRTSV